MTREINHSRSPHPLPSKFPTQFERTVYKSYHWVENRLWPIRPLPFAASCALSASFHIKFPSNFVLDLLPKSDNKVLETAKLALVSFSSAYVPVFVLRYLLKYFYFSYKGFLFENPKKPSLKTKIWATVRYLLSFSPPILESCDRLLPNQSVPALKDTIDKYLESMRYLMSKDELEQLNEQARSFVENEGRTLQSYAWLYSLAVDNYVTPFWEKYVYLQGRYPLMINSSVAHCDLIKDCDSTRAHRAARILWISVMSHLAVDRQEYKPLGDGLVCTRHYRKMYSVTREPGAECDRLVLYGIQKHVVCVYKGCYYKVQVCDEKNNIYSLEQMTKIFGELYDREDSEEDVIGKVAALTHDKRDQWHYNRKKYFLGNKTNERILRDIESSIFFFSLDDNDDYGYDENNPAVLSRFLKNMLTGNGMNRWVDKSLNYINSNNSRAGGTTEHSIADGAEFDHIMENFLAVDNYALSYDTIEAQKKMEEINENDKKTIKLAKRLNFEMVDATMGTEIERCFNEHKKSSDDVDLFSLVFRDFGKGRIKKCGCSPDAFIQMAIQLASYREHGKFVLTYEPASVRFYANSRTETLRTVNQHSCDFVNAMIDANETNERRIELLKKACETHVNKNKECMVGGGIDRHLFVLYVLSKGTGTSSAFLDNYVSQKWMLSTSHVPNVTNQWDEDSDVNMTWLGACFGAVAHEGYGVCYRVGGNHSIIANISSYHSAHNTDSSRFASLLTKALHDLSNLFPSSNNN